MSEYNTHATTQIHRVLRVEELIFQVKQHLHELDCDLLDEDAIDNLRIIIGNAEAYAADLVKSTRKLLD